MTEGDTPMHDRDLEAPWLDPDRYSRLTLCSCSICQEPMVAGDPVVFTDAGPICTNCLAEMDWRKFISISGLEVETLTLENAPCLPHERR